MQTIRIPATSDSGMAAVGRLIHNAGGLNPTVSAHVSPDQLIRSLAEHAPTIRSSVDQANGMFRLDLGALRFVWLVCFDQLGSCVIFLVSHFDREGLGAQIMMNFMEELKEASSRTGFEFGILDGQMYEAEPDICRILANGKVA